MTLLSMFVRRRTSRVQRSKKAEQKKKHAAATGTKERKNRKHTIDAPAMKSAARRSRRLQSDRDIPYEVWGYSISDSRLAVGTDSIVREAMPIDGFRFGLFGNRVGTLMEMTVRERRRAFGRDAM
nr:hypothetical protein [Burkholderia pseudomallei]